MRRAQLEDMVGGWFIGNFSPSAFASTEAEVCVKHYPKGSREPEHYQKVAHEVTCIISGEARMGDTMLAAGDIVVLEPFEACDFEALSDVILVAFKTPSRPDDKVLGSPSTNDLHID